MTLKHDKLHTFPLQSINRAEQFVEVDNGRKVQYDYLVLCTGSQFQCSLPQVILILLVSVLFTSGNSSFVSSSVLYLR